ncbi:MAG TPA: hypothetical protein HPP90_07140 [Deltaproteobacteria bacterium]|nr:hypothetical protein [Deltaproteobacteria bacterium]
MNRNWCPEWIGIGVRNGAEYAFEDFLQKIDLKILGVTKDKWKASTNALKAVFHRIWIGYCHRHCLKKFRDALLKYQKQSKCTDQEVTRLYKKLKEVLKTSTSKVNLEIKLKTLDDGAFSNPYTKKEIGRVKRKYHSLYRP